MRVMVLGASTKPNRYANIAINMLLDYEHEVVAVGKREGEVRGVHIKKGQPHISDVDTLTLYVGPAGQIPLYQYILDINPRRLIFNPGTENPELEKLCSEAEIETINACTLVMLRTNQFE